MRKAAILVSCALAFVVLATVSASVQQPAPSATAAMEGARNYHRIDAAYACGGTVTDQAIAGLKEQGFAAVIDFRTPDEADSNVAAEGEMARSAGLKYVNIPFSTKAPDYGMVDLFLKTVADPANQPAYIHCKTGNRAAMMWMIKRVVLDDWPIDKAVQEAQSLGLTEPSVRQVGLDYLKAHGK